MVRWYYMENQSRIEFNECLGKGLLKRTIPSLEKARKSIEKSERFLRQAESAFAVKAYDSSVITCYQAIFLSARSMLFRDGYREKSHACVGRYLEEKYAKTGKLELKWVELFDRFRSMRHDDEYNVFFFAEEADCQQIIKFASEFIAVMKKLVEK